MTAPRELVGKTALVTGAASGIGAACARAMAAAGADLILADREDPAEILAAVRAAGSRATATECDVSKPASVAQLFRLVDDFSGGLDIVVHSAGILIESAIEQMWVEDFDLLIKVNLRGTFLIGKEALPRLADAGDGRFIAIASELAQCGRANYSAYSASKAGVIGLVKSWAREYAPKVLVNAVAPGPVDTPMLSLESMSQETIDKETEIPLGRVGQPEEIALVVRFMAGPAASFMTGQTVSPNGGAVML